MFSKASEYAIKAVVSIAKETAGGRRSNLKAISQEIGSPEAFTAKILQQLTRGNIIQSTVGAAGGFEMNEQSAKHTKLKAIVTLFDGENIFKACGLGFHDCSEKHPCLLHEEYKPVRNQLAGMLSRISVFDLYNKTMLGKAYFKQ